MTQVIGLFPLTGNGGIASWTKIFLKNFPNEEFKILPISNSPGERNGKEGLLSRVFSGLKAMRSSLNDVKISIRDNRPELLHASTSGSLGTLRDYFVGRLCRSENVKSILHCHYGCIVEDYNNKGLLGWLLRHTLPLYDQIWVLDNKSYQFFQTIDDLKGKVFLSPNFMDVPELDTIQPKKYKRIGYIGNLIPSKGIIELVEACTLCDVRLDIIGPGSEDVIENIKNVAGDKLGKSIFLHGKLPNDEAVEYIKQLDMIALPTYYPWEAFPISILEAMSLGKLVISCPRAAIPDMLTDNDGNKCGLLVKPHSVDSIAEAIKWAQNHIKEADVMCSRSYEKVLTAYNRPKVFDLYRSYYRKLI